MIKKLLFFFKRLVKPRPAQPADLVYRINEPPEKIRATIEESRKTVMRMHGIKNV